MACNDADCGLKRPFQNPVSKKAIMIRGAMIDGKISIIPKVFKVFKKKGS